MAQDGQATGGRRLDEPGQDRERPEDRRPGDSVPGIQDGRHPGAGRTVGTAQTKAIRAGSTAWHIIWLAVILILIGIIIGGGFYIKRLKEAAILAQEEAAKPAPDPNVRAGTLGNDPRKRVEELESIVDEGMLTFSINATPSFDDGNAEGNLLIENPPGNGNRFTVTIVRKDTGEPIYKSGSLEPGQYIDKAPLDVRLPAGRYPCTAVIQTFRLADSTYIGQVAAELEIYIMN